jgi:TfoX/Sxy family transcriptional regulator of competence genes
MASKQGTIDYILDQIAGAGTVTAKKMFGEYGVFCEGKTVALVCDDQLFVKPTAAGKAFIGDYDEGLPYPGAKPWLLISGERWEDQDWLSELIALTARQLPPAQPKRPGRRRN